jgi:hypothetical protein
VIKVGNWLCRADEVGLAEAVGYNSFRAMYLDGGEYQNWQDVVQAYDLEEVTTFTFNKIRNIVVLEIANGGINQVLSLENEDETFTIFGDGRCGGIFNTDGAAFIQYKKGGVERAVFMIDNSPYDVSEEDEWYEFTCSRDKDMTRDIALQELNLFLRNRGVDIHQNPFTSENTIFVTQL